MEVDPPRRPLRDGQERPYALRVNTRGTMACRRCGGTEWVEVFDHRAGDGAFTPTLRPCECHPGYERWAKGWPRLEGARYSQPEFIPTRAEPVMQGQF